METEDTNLEAGQEQQTSDEKPESSQEKENDDYRGKLNATNRFLEKEGYKFENGRWQKPEAKTETQAQPEKRDEALDPKDLYALMENKVHSDDFEELQRLAKAYGYTKLSDALKDETIKTVLDRKAELRRTADATNTRTARPSTKKLTDAEVLARAERGEIPEPGSPEAEQLWRARRGIKS